MAHRYDRMMLERLLAQARVQFALCPVGTTERAIGHIFRRMMRRRRYLQSATVRFHAVARLIRLRRAAVFRVRVRTLGGIDMCFGVYRQGWVKSTELIDLVPVLLTLFYFLSVVLFL